MANDKEVDSLRRSIANFFRARRENIGWSRHELRQRAGLNSTQLTALEGDSDTVVTMPTFLRTMLELGLGLHITEQNADAVAVSAETSLAPPSFLTVLDMAGPHAAEEGPGVRQLYVLHWRRPSFLVQVVQTVPHHLRFVATWGATPAEIRDLPVWEEAMEYVRTQLAGSIDPN